MPKMKTRKSAAKRFRLTGSGKLVRRRAFKKHLLSPKSSKRKRSLEGLTEVHPTDLDRVTAQLPYLKHVR